MKDVDTKVIGYGLLLAGLLIIIFAGYHAYQVFTGQTEPIDLLNFPAIAVSLNPEIPEVELVPAEVLSKSSNLIVTLIFMGFVASIGTKFAGIGVQLVRPIKVNLRAENDKAQEKTNKK